MNREGNGRVTLGWLLGVIVHLSFMGTAAGLSLMLGGRMLEIPNNSWIGNAFWIGVVFLIFGGFVLNFVATFWILVLSGYPSIVPEKHKREYWVYATVYCGLVANVIFYWKYIHPVRCRFTD